ncbi:tRNA pseudouridine(38 39) synthase isoform X2 [Pelobates cultripes]|uniref:tRNA pseudouridine(38 39) synthase isoform X2 n=1 Tax=Pelobates cultripes TaxID=61616 RepID=A0AAD1SSM9_PELCU|nr:tRNA pseudouridine(38 39) synthase isoform X2 [Pelobates cultripes]
MTSLEEELKQLRLRVQELEDEVFRLGNASGAVGSGECLSVEKQPKGKQKPRVQRPFDFSAHPKQHVALRLAYLGWGYHGFASQENTKNTVEEVVFNALMKTRLVENRQDSNYHRCGRTDRGVSALSQVISLDLRSNPPGMPEIRYTHILNRVLPPDIRVLSWAKVPSSFSARFSCRSRTYRYLFPRAQLDIEAMDRAARLLQGTHDFRNLCKMDVANGVLNFTRTILRATVGPVPDLPGDVQPIQLCQLEITGLAFLYHQVRCIMGVLFLIGQRREKPEVIRELLDVETNPCKPQYNMAVELPLVLYDCQFNDVDWITERDTQSFLVSHLQRLWTQEAVKTQILHMVLGRLDSVSVRGHSPVPWSVCEPAISNHSDGLIEGVSARAYTPLMRRRVCQGLEERVQHYVKRGRIVMPSDREGILRLGDKGLSKEDKSLTSVGADKPKLRDQDIKAAAEGVPETSQDLRDKPNKTKAKSSDCAEWTSEEDGNSLPSTAKRQCLDGHNDL